MTKLTTHITSKQIEQLQKQYLNLSHIWCMEQIEIGSVVLPISLIDALYKKGFLSNDKKNLTEAGISFLHLFRTGKQIKHVIVSTTNIPIKHETPSEIDKIKKDFNEFIQIFPKDTAIWKINNSYYYNCSKHSEILRYNKKKEEIFKGGWSKFKITEKNNCFQIWKELIKDGYKGEEIIHGTLVDIYTKIEASILDGDNKLKFIKKIQDYLRSMDFDAHIHKDIPLIDNEKTVSDLFSRGTAIDEIPKEFFKR